MLMIWSFHIVLLPHVLQNVQYLAGNSEADRLDHAVRDLVGSGNLAVIHVQCALGHKGETALRGVRTELGQREQFVVLVLVVANVAVAVKSSKRRHSMKIISPHELRKKRKSL